MAITATVLNSPEDNPYDLPVAPNSVFSSYWKERIEKLGLKNWSLAKYEFMMMVTKENLNEVMQELD